MTMWIECGRNSGKGNNIFSGTLELTEHSLGARASGRIEEVLVNEGAVVKKGDLIARLDRYEQTKKDFERTSELWKAGGTNEQAVEYARLAMEDQEILSPVSGTILVKVREAGEVVQAGAPVVVVGNTDEKWVRIFIPEGMINRISMNQKARLHFDGLNRAFKGHVSFISTKAEFTPRNVQSPEERVTQTFAVKVSLDEDDSKLRAGVAADVRLLK